MSVGTVFHCNECKAGAQTFSHDRGTAAPALQLEKTTAYFPLSLPLPLLPHCGNGFSDLCLPITVRFTQHQPSDGVTHQHTSDIMNAPAPPPSPLMPAASIGNSWRLQDDKDEKNCVWDGDDDPDDDLQ